MADVKKTVQVEINVTGTNKDILSSLAKAFDDIAKSAKAASTAIGNTGFNKSLKNIKAPDSLGKIADELERIGKVKVPNVKQLADGFKALAGIKEPPDLTKFASEAKKFNEIKVPNIKRLAEGLILLTDSSLSMTAVGARLRIVQRNLKRFSEINVPNIKGIAEGLRELSAVSGKNINTTSFTALSTFLTSLSGLRIPNLKQLAEGLKNLTDSTLSMTEVGARLRIVHRNLKRFTEIKVPNISALVNGLKKLAELEVGPVTKKIKALNAALKELDKKGHLSSFSKFASDLNQITAALKRTQQGFQNFNETAKKASGNMRTWGDRIKNYFQYRVVADALMAIKTAIVSSWTAIKEYDQALKDLQAITGATGLEVQQMGETIEKVASTTKFSASEVAEGMRIIGQAGFSAAEAIQTMQAVSDLATGTLSSMASTVDLVTTAMRVFKIDASESASVADVFANAVNRSKLTIDKLRTSFNYVGPIARDVGVSFKETAAAMMTLANSGLRASTIGTGLRRVFAELADPSAKLTAAVKNAGLALGDIDPQTKGLREVIENLGLVISDTSIAFDIFGKRGAAAALALTDAEGQFNQMLTTVGRSGIAAQQAAKQMEGLGVQFKNLQDKLGLLAIQIGKTGITDALRLVINAARQVVDALTAVADTAFAKIIVKAGLLVGSLTIIIGLFNGLIALKIPTLFTSMAAAVAKFSASLAIAETRTGLLAVAFHPLVLAFAAVTAAAIYLFSTLDDAREASEKAAKLADEYAGLSKQFKDHRINTANMKEGSDELKEANLTLRDSLLKVATSTSGVAKEAAAAAAAISPLTGEINKETEAIGNLIKKVGELELINLVNSAKSAGEDIANQTSTTNRFVNVWKDAFTHVGVAVKGYGEYVLTALNNDLDKIPEIAKNTIGKINEYSDRARASLKFAKALQDGKKSFQEFDEYIKGLRGIANLTAQEEDLLASFQLLDERTQAIFEHLVKFGNIDLNDTGENIKKYLIENLKLTGQELEAVLAKVKILQESREGSFTNIIEKWAVAAEEGKQTVADFVDEYKAMGGKITEEQEKQIRFSQVQKESLVEQLEIHKKILKDEIQAGKDKEEAYKKYYENESRLIKASQLLRTEDAENSAAQLISNLIEAENAYKEKTKKIRIDYEDNADLLAQYLAKAEVEFEQFRKNLIAGVVDPKKLVSDMKAQETEIKAQYAIMYQEIELDVLNGRIKSEKEGNRQIRDLKQKEAAEIAKIWSDTYDKINEASGPDTASAKSARKKELEAQIKQGNLRVEKEKEILEEIAKEREEAYDRMEAQREVAYKKYEAQINYLVSEGVITFEEGEIRKLSAELRRYEQALMAAKAYRAGIDKITDPDEYASAIQAELQAEEDLYNAKSKALEDYNKKAKALNEDIIKDRRKLQREEASHGDKLVEIKKKNAEKLVDIEDDYADAIRDINYALQDKLADFEEKRLETVRKYAAKRKEVEDDYAASVNESNDSIQDSIDKINQRGLSDKQLERSKQINATRELAELNKRLSTAIKEANEEEIKSILNRTDKIQHLPPGKDQPLTMLLPHEM